MQNIDVITQIHQATSWNSYATHAGISPLLTTNRFLVEKIERPKSVRLFQEKVPSLETIQSVLSKIYCTDKFGRALTPSAGNINKVELTLLSYPEGVIYQINSSLIKQIAQMPAGVCEDLIYRQIKGSGWLILFSVDINCYIGKYGTRSYRFVLLEAGHLCQALLQEFEQAGISSCPLGGFNDYLCENEILADLNYHFPLYILAIGFSVINNSDKENNMEIVEVG